MARTLIERLTDLEARVAALESPRRERWEPLPQPEPISEPLDVLGLWQQHTDVFGSIPVAVEDDEDWHGGLYL